MDIEWLQKYCLAKENVKETLPFGPDTLVYKVSGKIFLITGLDSEEFSFSVKCDPELAVELRENYSAVQPGYHLNKKHWNSVTPDGSISLKQLKEWIDHSYDLIVESLPKKKKSIKKKTK